VWGRSQLVPLLLQKNISLSSDAPNGKMPRNVPWQEAGKAGGRRGLQVLARGTWWGGMEQPVMLAHHQLGGHDSTQGSGSFSHGCCPSPTGCRIPPANSFHLAAAPVLVMVSSEEEESDSSETEREDDEGIVFVARATDEVLQGKTTPGRHRCSHARAAAVG